LTINIPIINDQLIIKNIPIDNSTIFEIDQESSEVIWTPNHRSVTLSKFQLLFSSYTQSIDLDQCIKHTNFLILSRVADVRSLFAI